MKRECYLLGLLLLSALIIYGCTAQEISEEEMPEVAVEDIQQEAEIPETIQEVQSVDGNNETSMAEEPEQIIEEEEEFQIFDPVLTYDGAYNGPLYGTSEQVGSASMDSYFELLDKNGINFFIGMFSIFGEPASDTLVSNSELGKVIDSVQKHPNRVIPFFNPGIGGEEVGQYLGETLTGWYEATLTASEKITGKGFIRGFGEIETQEWQTKHNDPKVLQIINIAQEILQEYNRVNKKYT